RASVRVADEDGIVYNLFFGNATFAQGEALTAGSKEEATKSAESKKAEPETPPPGGVESRFLFVTARFDATRIPGPKPAPPEGRAELPADPFQRTPAERAERTKADKEKADRDKAEHDRKLAAGQKRAKELTERFADWYYVV